LDTTDRKAARLLLFPTRRDQPYSELEMGKSRGGMDLQLKKTPSILIDVRLNAPIAKLFTGDDDVLGFRNSLHAGYYPPPLRSPLRRGAII
jgi:hypothetical protein